MTQIYNTQSYMGALSVLNEDLIYIYIYIYIIDLNVILDVEKQNQIKTL